MKKLLLILLVIIMSSCQALAGGGGGGGGKGKISEPKPEYYSMEDLRAELKCHEFYFANQNKPAQAFVDLGYNIYYPASANKRLAVTKAVTALPGTYRIDSAKITSSWNDSSPLLNFDWNNFWAVGGDKGDLIFTRANNKDADLIKIFSNWTHVAMAYDVNGKKVFESMPRDGVNIYYAPDSWGKLTYYTCRRVEGIPYSERVRIVNEGKEKFSGIPYYVGQKNDNVSRLMNLKKWADKNDMDSMYCSKLVWHVYKPYIDLDTQNTCIRIKDVFDGDLIDKAIGAPAFSWIGISPDDIYYSNGLGWDFGFSDNCKLL